jgi:hypothetical protein
VTFGNYTFVLNGADLKNANITVRKNISLSGYLTGHITIGPFCPVERVDDPCKTPESAYTSREALVYASNSTTVINRVHLDKNGNYNFALTPGKYFVQIDPAGIGKGEKKPATIKASETTVINFDIDTGIR